MKEFNHNGLLLAEYQAKLFERSSDLECSSPVFLRRFLHSDLLKTLDKNNPVLLSMDVNEGIESIMEQYGPSNYGQIKYAKSSLFWMGYMYRYIAYTRQQSTRFVMKLFPYRELNDLFFVYQTQSPEWCIERLLESKNLTEDYFDNNYRLKMVIKKYYEKNKLV